MPTKQTTYALLPLDHQKLEKNANKTKNTTIQFSPPPQWNTKFDINLDLTKFKKSNINPIIYKNLLHELLQTRRENEKTISTTLTPGTKSDNGVRIAIIHKNLIIRYKLPDIMLHIYGRSHSNP